MIGTCQLCKEKRKLRESHIIPSFIFKWLKASSGTGYLRFGTTPNLRSQDGYRGYYLCDSCERLFNTWETQFANSVFHPLNKGDAQNIRYGPSMLKFAVSVSWRVLLYFINELGLSHFPSSLREKAIEAKSYWERFLLGKVPHPSKYEQHLIPLDRIGRFAYPDMPPNINRYIFRTVDIDTVHSGEEVAYVYTKMCRILIIGFIEVPRPRDWKGSKLHVKSGTWGSKHYVIPSGFGDYFIKKAKRLIAVQSAMSEKQKNKIDETYKKDMDRAEKSETIEAMDYDIFLFGNRAFTDDE